MEKKLWIGLEGMEFYAYHGCYQEERKTGGRYLVDVMVYTNAELAETLDDLGGTVNYEEIYGVVARNMAEPVKLIEHLASRIMGDLRKFVTKDDFIRIKIQKLHPPLNGKIAAAVVLLEE